MQLSELPLDELTVVRIGGGCEAAPIRQEAEPLPVLVHIHLVEEVHNLLGLGQLSELLRRAAVGQKVVDGLLVLLPDPLGQRYGPVAGGMGPHGEQYIEPAHPLVARDRIHVGVTAHVAHVEVAGQSRVGEDHHELGPIVPIRLKYPGLIPALLPLGLYLRGPARHITNLLARNIVFI
ncbi:MAG: hypothetical protein A4E30_00498 [Methanomassiliicoccales archaeon PtaB.Bin215]|nr:MAG: hypothetical protein A4E30_00498 [Methanomassiliicoccales archaeon PtaB.Bin215]